jgi:hypothetical protein
MVNTNKKVVILFNHESELINCLIYGWKREADIYDIVEYIYFKRQASNIHNTVDINRYTITKSVVFGLFKWINEVD